jgi:hypothetical protein
MQEELEQEFKMLFQTLKCLQLEGVAFEKASAVLQPTVDTVKEEISTVELNKKLEEGNVELAKALEQFERDTPKVLPTTNAGAFAVTNRGKRITITHISR